MKHKYLILTSNASMLSSFSNKNINDILNKIIKQYYFDDILNNGIIKEHYQINGFSYGIISKNIEVFNIREFDLIEDRVGRIKIDNNKINYVFKKYNLITKISDLENLYI